jgi:DNA end-binding protein Ku
MPAAGTWKGMLKLSFVTCAVRLIPATSDAEHVSFHLINPDTGNRIRMKTHDAETDDVIDRKDLVKGYEYEKDKYVLLDESEIDALRIESMHTLDIARFVNVSDIDRRYFDTPYYLVPNNKMAGESYRVIQQAMAQENLIGIAKLVVANRERVVAIEPRERGFVVTTLRSPDELRDFESLFQEIEKKSLDREMIKMAKQLIERMVGAFEPKMFEDTYQEALRDLVAAKQKGIKPARPKPTRTGNVINLFEALQKSVGQKGGTASKSAHGKSHSSVSSRKRNRKVRRTA